MKRQILTIVGAGPGDPDLLTIKALKAIQAAKAILYDALVSEEILSLAHSKAILIPVGKRCNRHSMDQETIHLTIIQSVYQYGHVVRLKGGDPFIYGRGHEELEYARAFNIEVELVPGISSATALPLLQQVPLTRRGMAESFWVLTGTSRKHQLSRDIHLAVQSTATLVILMGLRKVDEICQLYVKLDKGNTPMMIILSGSSNDEKAIISTAHDMPGRMCEWDGLSAGIIVIGEVVKLHPEYLMACATKKWNL